MPVYIKFQLRGLNSIFRMIPAFFPILTNHQIKYHIWRNDSHICFIKPLMIGRIDTCFKIHPFMKIFRIPASLCVPAGITSHRDLIAYHCLVISFFLWHRAAHSILVRDRWTVVVDPDRITTPGYLIQIFSHHRFSYILILRRIKPAHISPCRTIIPHTLRLNFRNIPYELLSQHKFRI